MIELRMINKYYKIQNKHKNCPSWESLFSFQREQDKIAKISLHITTFSAYLCIAAKYIHEYLLSIDVKSTMTHEQSG